MPMCFVTNCSHQGLRETCSMFRFPKEFGGRWEKLCRRQDRTLDIINDRICSCHFKNGEKQNGPTIFPWNKDKVFDFPEAGTSKRRKRLCPETNIPDNSLIGACGGEQLSTEMGDHVLHDHNYQASYSDMAEDIQRLKKDVADMTAQIENLIISEKKPFCINDICKDESKMLMYTSLKYDMFEVLDGLIQRFELNYIDGWTPKFISRTNQLLLTLMKLTMNNPILDLAERFCTSKASVNNIFITHIFALHEILYEGFIDGKIPSLLKCKGSMPASFGDFSSCRLIIDATEISQDVPGNDLNAQSKTYSNYKNRHTVKSVIGVAPNGAIVYVSKLYPGSVSDVAIVEHSKMLSLLEPGDMILADKGFTIHKLMPEGAQLNIPPFLVGKSQYTPAEVQLCRKIAKSRIHVERANERIKNYAILDHIPQQYRYISTKLFQVCCVLVNFQDPLIQEIAQAHVVDEMSKDNEVE